MITVKEYFNNRIDETNCVSEVAEVLKEEQEVFNLYRGYTKGYNYRFFAWCRAHEVKVCDADFEDYFGAA